MLQIKWLQHAQRMDTNKVTTTHTQRMETNRMPKQALQYKPKERRNMDGRGRDGGTNFILRIKEKETRLILHEHGDDDDDFSATCFDWY